jgi:transposase
MASYVGLDVSLEQTAICVVDGDCGVVWQGFANTHPEMILRVLDRWAGKIARLGLETGSITPWLAWALKARGLPVIVME